MRHVQAPSLVALLALTSLLPACCPGLGPCGAAAPRPAPAAAGQAGPTLARADFNRLAARLGLPLFWQVDERQPGQLDPDELVTLGVGVPLGDWVRDGAFTPAFADALARLREARRREAVAAELDAGKPTLVSTDFSAFTAAERQLVRHLASAAAIIEELYARQKGSYELRGCAADEASAALFARNQGPWCEAPGTENDPFCNACPHFPRPVVGLYPAELQADKGFCDALAARPDADALFDPFAVVRAAGDELRAVPYHQVYTEPMARVAEELRAAAALLGPEEAAFKAYLDAAARAFVSNEWPAADEAWAAMNAGNSRWYLRIGPDEVYYEPCSRKAGFHTSFALIDRDSIYWQEKLTSLRQELEQALADAINGGLAAPVYAARPVAVHIPDFIEIVLNAGDARSAIGATIGQSLPNWGAVATEGRGRTVVMTNLYTDPDSRAVRRAQAEAMLAPESMAAYTEDKRLATLDIILHEITHNFGPISDYKLDGRGPDEIFGGPLASTLEELKAQTGALFYVEILRQRGLLSAAEAAQVYHHSLTWAFGHLSRGLFTAEGKPKPYSQLSAVQVGWLMRAGALTWEADRLAANGSDQGRFTIHFDKVPAAVAALMHEVGRVKASGDVAGATALIAEYVSGAGAPLAHVADAQARLLRWPKASFVYAVSGL